MTALASLNGTIFIDEIPRMPHSEITAGIHHSFSASRRFESVELGRQHVFDFHA
jgi:hypothetical protein